MEKRTNGAEKRTNGVEKRTNGAEKRTNDAEKRTNGAEKRTNGAEKRKCTLGPPYYIPVVMAQKVEGCRPPSFESVRRVGRPPVALRQDVKRHRMPPLV